MKGPALAGVCVAMAACAPSVRVEPPRYAAVTRPMVAGAVDGVRVPDGMRLVAGYGEDRWRFADHVRFGPANGALVPAWDGRRIYLVARATGQPVAALWHDEPRTAAVAVDDSGTRVAALAHDGSVRYWPRLDAAPVHLVARRAPAAGGDPVKDDLVEIGQVQRHGYVATEELTESDGWPQARALRRLAFSPDGTRLLAGMHLWELATGRDLLPLRSDELVLDADHDRAIVARLIVIVTEGQPGSQCGYIPTYRSIRMVAYERRHVGGAVESLLSPGARAALPAEREVPASIAARGPGHPGVPFQHIASIDVADDGRLVYVQRDQGWLVDRGQAQALRVADDRAAGTSFDSVTLGDGGAIYAVVHEHDRSGAPSAAYAMDATGAARVRVPGMLDRIARDGRAVIGRDGGLEAWRLAGAPDGDRLDFRPRSLHSIDQGRAAGRDRVVLRDGEAGGALYVVHEPGRAPRVLRLPGDTAFTWALSPDGATAAASNRERLRIFSLDDGRVSVDHPLTPETAVWSLTASAHVVAAGSVDGRVHLWRGGAVAEIDLGDRFDVATALAISPDERQLAIGTARGRIFVIALDRTPRGSARTGRSTPATDR